MLLLALLTASTLSAQLRGSGIATDPYLISSADDWETLTNNINNGVGTTSYYKLTNDLTLGTELSPITTIVGTKEKPFMGVLDGDYHTIHINMYREVTYAAPFGVTNGATIKNLKVDGDILTSNKFAAGFIAYANNTNGKSTKLINCVSSIHIICDKIVTVDPNKPFDCTHAGLVGQNESGVLEFENCIFDGWIKDTRDNKIANKCTGFVAWVNNTVNYKNCIMAGEIDVKPNDDELPNSMANFHRLGKSGKANFKGTSYYLTDYTYHTMTVQGTQAPTTAQANVISRKYTVKNVNYYIPAAEIKDYDVTFCGWTLKEGRDYLINILESADSKLVYAGINDFGGQYEESISPVFQMDIETWDDVEKTGWYAISSPVKGQAFSAVTHLTSNTVKHNIYRYNEEKRLWEEYRNEANEYTKFEMGRGYLYRTEYNGGNIGYNGKLNTGDVDIKLSYTKKDDKLSGFNLIGNPYSHNIYKSVAIPNDILIDGYCTLTEQGTWEYNNDSNFIPEGTAVLVQVSSAAKGDYSITLKDTDDAPASKGAKDEIWFTVNGREYSDVAHVEFEEGEGFNKMIHYNADAPMLYVKHNGENFASAKMSANTESINLCFETKAMGQYTMTFKAKGSYDYLHLIDRVTGDDVDMLVDDEYTFIGSSCDDAERFIVKLSASTGSENGSESFAWQSGSDVMVKGDGELQVFDVTGRMVMSASVSGIETINVPSQGVYILKMLGNNVKTQKIVVK